MLSRAQFCIWPPSRCFLHNCSHFSYRSYQSELRFAYSYIELVEYGVLKVALPSHSDRIADITVGPSHANELNRSRGNAHRAGWWVSSWEVR